jgi:hypothetical protein
VRAEDGGRRCRFAFGAIGISFGCPSCLCNLVIRANRANLWLRVCDGSPVSLVFLSDPKENLASALQVLKLLTI